MLERLDQLMQDTVAECAAALKFFNRLVEDDDLTELELEFRDNLRTILERDGLDEEAIIIYVYRVYVELYKQEVNK